MALNSPFFDMFPKIDYDVKRVNGSHPEKVPNLFFRIGYLKSVLAQSVAYDTYRLEDGDTPEIIAEKVYGDSGAGWMVIYANKIMDPQFDWPLNDSEFEAYIIGKYGSVEKAQTLVDHAEKNVTIENVTEGETHTSKHIISVRRYSENKPNVPFDYWVWKEQLTLGPIQGTVRVTADTEQYVASYNLLDITADLDLIISDTGLARKSFSRQYQIDKNIYVEVTTGKLVSAYDHELELNEEKKFIRVIKALYYPQIMNEFKILSGHNTTAFSRLM